MTDFQTCIIGAGVVGLAVAAELSKLGHEVIVLEQAKIIGSETSSRNSEVIHAGIYYPKDSLKAKLCVEGKGLLYQHCADFHVAYKKIGKWIVASDKDQLDGLTSIKQRAAINGVEDLEFFDAAKCSALEPELNCVGALNSPSTGIIDSHAFMISLQGILESHAGQIAFDTKVTRITKLPGDGFTLETISNGEPYEVSAKNLIVCTGLHTTQLLMSLAFTTPFEVPPTHYAKGNYFRLEGKAPFKRLIYPVPVSGGLGVHLTLDLGGQARFGPDVEWVERLDYGVSLERSEKFYSAIRKYWRGLPDHSLQPDYAGIRPKLALPGQADADFVVMDRSTHGVEGLVALMGIESPGLTASLALAKYTTQFV